MDSLFTHGQKITVTLTSGNTIDGFILAADLKEKTNSVVIGTFRLYANCLLVQQIDKSEHYEVHLINSDCIADYTLDKDEHLTPCTILLLTNPFTIVPSIKQLADLSETTVEAKLRKNVDKYRKYLAGLNDQVSSIIQRLFDDLSKQYDCEWREGNIIYFKDFDMSVKPPYTPTSCEGGSNDRAKERVKHILTEFATKTKVKH